MARPGASFISLAKEIERANKRDIAQQAKANRERIKRQKELEKKRMLLEKEKAINYAKKLTIDSERDREVIVTLIKHLNTNPKKFDWNKYKDYTEFKEYFSEENLPERPDESKYKVEFSIIHFLMPSIKERKEETLNNKLLLDIETWKNKCEQIEMLNNQSKDSWQKRKNKFKEEQDNRNSKIDELKKLCKDGTSEGMEFYLSEVLNSIKYPDYFMNDWELKYNDTNNMVIVEYNLPKKSDINNVKQVKYVQVRKEYSESYIKEADINKIYETSLYQLCLRVNHDIYINDKYGHIKSIVFNGYLTDINKSNGIEETKCILSLQTEKETFMKLNLAQVDAKICFKSLKGVAGAKLSDVVAVAPIANIESNDKRFVESREIGEKINGYNLAAMNWEDFEHLIREVFEKEFAKEGAEVKITQASRDGGVDAVIFDPHPIRGGKYIVQAKRYTNVVGVSAVRDLYGTVMNEGASKGILVTTSDYGSDSYNFAKDKPITLLNGSNLLHMLENHGYEARIDINEAKVEIKNLKNDN